MKYSICFVDRELESYFLVKSTAFFSKVASYYLSNVGLSSATFYLAGNKTPLNTNSASSTVQDLGIRDNTRIFVKNAKIANLDNNFAIEVSVHDSNGSMGTRGYSIKRGTTCKSLISTLKVTFQQSNLSLFSGGNMVDESHIISEDKHFDAICY